MEDRHLFKAKRIDNGEWVEGALLLHDTDAATIFNQHPADGSLQGFEVGQSTICQCTGLKDKNGKLIWENDIVDFLRQKGLVKYECGSFGIGFKKTIDWEEITSYIMPITGCENALYACENDNYISLWEIYWNFNDEDDSVNTVEVIGNIFDGGFNGKNSKKD